MKFLEDNRVCNIKYDSQSNLKYEDKWDVAMMFVIYLKTPWNDFLNLVILGTFLHKVILLLCY